MLKQDVENFSVLKTVKHVENYIKISRSVEDVYVTNNHKNCCHDSIVLQKKYMEFDVKDSLKMPLSLIAINWSSKPLI